jgi:hypothetical protein
MTEEQTNPLDNVPYKLAFILDGEVADILHTDERLSAIFLSNPLVLDISQQLQSNPAAIMPHFLYNAETGEFTAPPEETAVPVEPETPQA